MSTVLVCGLLAAVYLAINLALPAIGINSLLKFYLIQPLLWGTLILAVHFLPGYRPLGKASKRNALLYLALGLGLIEIIFYFIGGMFSGFGKSPSSFTPQGIAENIFLVGMMLAGMELSRAWLVGRFGKKHSFLAIGLATLAFTFISIPLRQVGGFQLNIESTNQVMSSWLPLLAENLAASFLVLIAGARASLVYRGLLAAFWWLCPILPNLDWAFKGFIGAVVPVLGIVVINNYYSSQAARSKSKKNIRHASLPTGWILTAIICVVLIWFAIGVFPVKPAVIPTGSMVPVFDPGDIVLIAKVKADKVKVGEIIEYRTKTINIVHRVIQIEKNGDFITKGDANNAADPAPVNPANVDGRFIARIPKVGWISIFVKQLFSG